MVEFIHKDVIAVHADTMTVTSGIVGESGMAKVDILLHNYLRLRPWLFLLPGMGHCKSVLTRSPLPDFASTEWVLPTATRLNRVSQR